MDYNQMSLFKTNSYHNSVPERDEQKLGQYEKQAQKQDEIILALFKKHRFQDFTPVQIHMMIGQKWPLTSVRRAITNLTKAGKLVITDNKRPGLYGRENNTWQYNNLNNK